MKNKIDSVVEILRNKVSNLEYFIDLYAKKNQALDPLNDGFIEVLHSVMYDTMCIGSGGSGWDTIDKGESKYCHWLQGRNCNHCKEWDPTRGKNGVWKYNRSMFFRDTCAVCGSSDLGEYPADSRWGVGAKEHIIYSNQLIGYRLAMLEPTIFDPSCRTFRLRSWLINTNDPYLSEYALRQYESPSSNTINLQPLKRDFYRASPMLHLDALIGFNDIIINYFDTENNTPEPIPVKYNKLTIQEIMDKKNFGKPRGKLAR